MHMKNPEIAFVLGTRPEIIKCFSLIKAAHEKEIPYILIHTNQHYDPAMDSVFFDELAIPRPTHNLHVGSGAHGVQTAKMLMGIEEVLLQQKPKTVFVQGDTNSVLAGALAATKLQIAVGHIEAGLRSYDRTMPEEANRIMTDHIADYLYPPTQKQEQILLREGIDAARITITGNTVVDAVNQGLALAKTRSIFMQKHGLREGGYLLLTCHRPSNTDDTQAFTNILQAAQSLGDQNDMPVIFPLHPRLQARKNEISAYSRIQVIEPLGYLDMLIAQSNAHCILTDSGGIQEESCILEKQCVILRTNTERPETVEVGGAVLIKDSTPSSIIDAYTTVMSRSIRWTKPFGDGTAYQKILASLGLW
jgi:UDP-N-acetylglucosamine 2-epimerase (non-hydrolysing)